MHSNKRKLDESFVDSNYKAFVKLLPSLILEHKGKYALLHSNELKGTYTTFEDAEQAGENFLPDNKYIVQFISQEPADLGYFSRAFVLA